MREGSGTLMPERSSKFFFLHILSVKNEEIFKEKLTYHRAHFTLITESSKQDS